MSRMQRAAKALLGRVSGYASPRAAGRGLTVRDDDVFLVSYPRSGNTWMRFLIHNLLHAEEPASFTGIDRGIPGIYRHTDRALRHLPGPRILKSHERFDPRYKKVIYIARDPRDVLISYYHYHLKLGRINETYSLDEYASHFVAGELDSFGSWGENAGSWLEARRGSEGFLLLRYEDLLKHPERELDKVASLLQANVPDEQLARAVSLSSAEHMRVLEKEGSWKAMKNTRIDKAFVRSAREGVWKHELPAASVAKVEAAWGGLMRELGYLLPARGKAAG